MSAEETLHDVSIRVQQLEEYIMRSPEYLRRADQEIKRQVATLYLAIALLLVFQGLFTLREAGHIPFSCAVLTAVTSILAIVNCLLLIRTKASLRRLNDAWLGPQERTALNSLRFQRDELLSRVMKNGHTAAEVQNVAMN